MAWTYVAYVLVAIGIIGLGVAIFAIAAQCGGRRT